MSLEKIPSVLQLPGGVTVRGFGFRVTKLDDLDRPLAVELMRDDDPDFDCTLWAADFFLGMRLPEDTLKRVKQRIEDSIEPREYETRSRDVVTP